MHLFGVVTKVEFTQRYTETRNRPRFFDQVGHQTKYASIGNKHFFSLNNVIVRPTKIMNRADKNWAHF